MFSKLNVVLRDRIGAEMYGAAERLAGVLAAALLDSRQGEGWRDCLDFALRCFVSDAEGFLKARTHELIAGAAADCGEKFDVDPCDREDFLEAVAEQIDILVYMVSRTTLIWPHGAEIVGHLQEAGWKAREDAAGAWDRRTEGLRGAGA